MKKRSLFEALAGLAVVVLMVSFHQRISQLRGENADLARLRHVVEETVANAGSKHEIASSREQILTQVSARLDELQQQLESTQQTAANASFLTDQIEATRREATLLRAELTRDVQRTQQLVANYEEALRKQEAQTRTTIDATQRRVEEVFDALVPDPGRLNADLLAPTVQLNGVDTVGSGTLIASNRDSRTGRADNYVITSYHVVRNIYADSPRAKSDGISVTLWRGEERVEVRGRMISFDADIDAALLRLDTDETFDRVARVLPRELVDSVEVWDPVYALGCPLGNDPIPTTGELSSKNNVLGGTNYWMINAPTYYGNSGGGVYLAEGNYLVGVFSKIYTHGKGNPIVVPHMGLCTPITSIYDWLDRESLAYVLPDADSAFTAAAGPGK